MSKNLEKMLVGLRDERVSFPQFMIATRAEYRSIACYLMRKWSTPEWFVLEDVEQELYTETWRLLRAGKHDPTLGVSLQRYVVYNSIAVAKREMHKARGVTISGSPDRKVSRFEKPLSHFEDKRGEDGTSKVQAMVDEILSGEDPEFAAIHDADDIRRSATDALKVCQSKDERYAVLAIREAGSLDNAPSVLYDDIDHRIALRLGSEEKAERFVRKHASAVADRIFEAALTRVNAAQHI